jgi:hypothetical protein
MSNIQRPRVVRNRLLRITSYGQVQYDSNGHVSVSLPKTIQNVQTMRVQSYSFPYSFFNIDAHNNKLSVVVRQTNGSFVTFSITLASQHYEVFSFLSALAAALNLVNDNAFTATYSSLNNKITITGTRAFTFLTAGTTMNLVLGFSSNIDSTLVNSLQTVTFTRGVNLLRSPELLVNCDQIVSYSSLSLAESVLFTVPLSGFMYGDSLYHQQDHVPIPVKETSISSLVFKITDVEHNVVDFKDYHWVINLILEVVE